MRPTSSNQRWFAATVCLLALSGTAVGQEGVVRMSDAATRPGVVRMTAVQQAPIRQIAYAPGSAAVGYRPTMVYRGHQFATPNSPTPNLYRPTGVNGYTGQHPAQMRQVGYSAAGHSFGCTSGGCSPGCGDGSCGGIGCTEGCCHCDSGCRSSGCDSRRSQRQMRKNGWESCDECYYGDGYRNRMVTLFTPALPKDCCGNQRWACRWWRGQQHNYLARNQRLANCLFGWLVPSGCCGQGCPPVGKYCMTYADDPGYSDSRDGGQAYGVQGYGVPMSVPLAPNVRQAYNYSWGTPSSRITPLGSYNGGGGTPQPLYHQSW